jgi:antitoxin component YwqK of YwqJK toxin-antitoxin module
MLLLQSCQKQIPKVENKKDEKMNYLESKYFTRYKEYTTEKFDVEAYEEIVKRQKGRRTLTLEDGTIIQMSRPYSKDMTFGVERTSQGFIRISPSRPYFIEIVKIFSPKGSLTRQGFFISGNKIGIAQEFNERGKLIKEIDYEKKDWSKYHYRDVLKFLDEKKIINLKTGEGRGTFDFYLDRENEKWHIEISESFSNGFVATMYILDANTLKVLDMKKEQRGME